ncbi:MAG: DUF5979 domain-containing protein, partial [Lachnospiraceae bacterium]|nr:DUF5979 domain-containing protein [Lachnospiraceae bacterium]
MKRRKVLKSTVAMIALTAMLLENTYSVLASVDGQTLVDPGDNLITVESQEGDSLAVEEGSQVQDTGDALIDDTSEDTIPDENAVKEIDISIPDENSSTGTAIHDENALRAYSDRIESMGINEVSLYINTDQMTQDDSFDLTITGGAAPEYDNVLNGALTKKNGGVYYITELEEKQTIFRVKSMSDGMSVEYKIRNDGNPQITLISKDIPAAEKVLEVSANGRQIKGSGYDDITITFDASTLKKNSYFAAHIQTAADVMCDGSTVRNGVIPSLSKSTKSIRLSGLNNEAFTIYVEGENVEDIAAEYSVDSVDNGAVGITVRNADGSIDTDEDSVSENGIDDAQKRVYEYEDSKVFITVTLQDPADLPDDAVLNAVELTEKNQPEKLDEVLGRIYEDNKDSGLMIENVYVYDITFTVDGEEVEPSNPVEVNIVYKQKVESAPEAEVEDVKTFHFSEDEVGNITSMDEVTDEVVTDRAGEVEEVTVSLESFSTVATAQYTTNRTLIGDGGSYSLGYILNNYNLFVQQDIENHNHTIGAMAAGGDAFIQWWGNHSAIYKANSYIKGTMTPGTWFDAVGGDYLFLGNVNTKNGIYYNNDNKGNGYYGYRIKSATMDQGINYVKGVYYTDNYIDFNAAFNSIKQEISEIQTDYTIDLKKATGDGYTYDSSKGVLTLIQGNTYSIDSVAGINKINIKGDNIESPVDTIVVINSSNDINGFPSVQFNGTNVDSIEFGRYTSVVFAIPNAKNIKMGYWAHFGHLVAPNAYVRFEGGGNYNGCVIARKFYSESFEGHMWPYNGKKFEGSSAGFKISKTVDGNTPTSDQVFEFKLEELKNGSYTTLQTIKNNGRTASFDTLSFNKNDAGTHYYRISEVKGSGKFEYDPTVYMVVVKVENVDTGYSISQKVTEKYYNVTNGSYSDLTKRCTSDKQVSSMTFDNKEIIELGSISLTKGVIPSDASTGTFYVTVQNSNGEYYNESKKAFDRDYSEVELKVGTTKTISDLEYDTYTVTEVKSKALDSNGNEYEVTYNVNGTSKTCQVGAADQSCTVVVDGDENVGITNKMAGQIKVTKQYVDVNGKAVNDGTTFYVVLSSGSGRSTVYYDVNGGTHSGKQVVRIGAGETVTFKPVPAGLTYTVTETDSKGNAISGGLEYDVKNGSQSFTLDDSSVANISKAVTVTNIKHATGKINILKKDQTNKAALDGAEFILKNTDTGATVYVSGQAGAYSYTADTSGTSVLTTKSGSLYVDQLPYGNYTIEEVTFPYGYRNETIVMKFTVGANGVVNSASNNSLITASMKSSSYEGTYTVYNRRIPFRVRIVKKYSELLGGGEKPLSGVTFTLKNEGTSTTVTGITDSNGVVEFADLDWGTYTYTETVPEGYVATSSSTGSFTVDNTTSRSVVDLSGTPVYVINVSNIPVSGSVKLVKKDADTDAVMPSVTFHLYDVKGNEVYSVLKNGVYNYAVSGTEGATASYVTDKNGEINVTGLPYGSGYYFTEETPAGYVVNNGKYTFNVSSNGTSSTVTVKNKKIRGYAELIKTDSADGSVLKGASFDLYKKDGTKVGSYTTDEYGKIGSDKIGPLEYGSYYFKETAAPEGYDFDASKTYEFTIRDNTTKAVSITATNTRKKGMVSLIKYDADTGRALKGATFGLYKADDLKNPVATGITDDNGKLSFEDLEWGSYVIKEISAPKGYTLDTGSYGFETGSDTLVIDLTDKYKIFNKETPGAIRLIKNDGEGHTLEGAVFELYKDGKRYPDSQTTFTCDENGEITVTDLPWGTYYFVEISAPEGFVLPSGDAAKSSSVTINADNTISALTAEEKANGQNVHINIIAIANERIYGDLLLHKVDSDGKSLVGATFELYSVDGDDEIPVTTSGSAGSYSYDRSGKAQVLDTDGDGYLSVKGLPYGYYRVREKKAPSGYNLDTNPCDFRIVTKNQVATYDFENTLIKANIRFIKVDINDGPIEGVSFTLYKLVDGEYKPYTTVQSDADGIVSVEGLGAGTYYFRENALEGYEVDEKKMYGFTITEENNGQTFTLPDIDHKVNGLAAIVNTPLKGKAVIKKVAADSGSALSGAVFALYDAKTNKVVKGYEELTTGLDGYASAEGLDWGTYYFKEVKAPAGYALDKDTKYEFTIDASNVSSTINAGTVKDTLILGGGKLVKKDAQSKEVLSGAEFALYDENDKAVQGYESIVSDENGIVTTKADLKTGTYYFVETKAPKGYVLDKDTRYYFIVDGSNMGRIVEANAEGKKDNTAYDTRLKGKAELYKFTMNGRDEAGLKGAEFTLYYKGAKVLGLFDNDKEIGTYTTDEKGIIRVEDLEWGDYYFVETKAPTGFDKNETPIEFTIDADNLDHTDAARFRFPNTPGKGSIQLIKVDEKTGNRLVGASFILWQEVDGVTTQIVNTGSSDGLFTTDSTGQITVTGLDWGTYYFEEVAAPSGYILPEDRMSEKKVIDKDNVEVSVKTPLIITMLNGKAYGSLELIKTNEDGTIVLEGAKFEIYSDANYRNKIYAKDNGNGSYEYTDDKSGAVSTFVTASTGGFTVDGIPVGTYYIKETEAPEGYLITVENAGVFTIDERNTDENRQEVNLKIVYVKDQRIKGYVELTKVDAEDASNKLNGVEFDLIKVTDGKEEPVGHYETVDGKISKDTVGALEYGTYYFKETATVDGYKLNDERYDFTISEQDKVIQITATNTRELGKVVFEKYNSDRTKKLDGAVYELYSTNPDGTVQKLSSIFGKEYHKVGDYTTANGGVITVENLAWGNYYFVEIKAPTGYVLDKETKYSFTIDADHLVASLTNEKGATDEEEKGAIKLIKDDGEGHTLSGADFVLYKDGERYPDDEKVYTTNGDGEIIVNDLPYGTYYFVEISAPEGFILPEGDAAKSTVVVIDEKTSVSSVDINVIPMSNQKIYGSLDLKKVDQDRNGLEGAEFYLVKVEDGSEKNVKLNGENGSYSFDKEAGNVSERQTLVTNGALLSVKDLPYGTYRVYESKAPKGYNRIETPFEFVIDSQGKHVTYEFENSLIQAGVEFVKTDEDGQPLSGAVFTLYKKTDGEDVSLGTVTSDSKGVVKKSGLGAGEYYFIETQAPAGYIASDKEYTFKITAEDNGKTVSIDNPDTDRDGVKAVIDTAKKGAIVILKKDETTKAALDGAEFYLKNDDTDALIYVTGNAGSYTYSSTTTGTSVLTTSGGSLRVDELPYGNYRIEEITYPYGYQDSDIEMRFSIGTEGVVNKSVSNKLITASMQKGEYEGTYTV